MRLVMRGFFLTVALVPSSFTPCFATSLPVNSGDYPALFWRDRPGLVKNLAEDRKIIVNAKTERETLAKPARMEVVAGGYVHVPIDHAWAKLREYEKLPQIDDRFKSAHYDPASQTLELDLAALGFHALMTLKLKEDGSADPRRIYWECIHGSFEGMKGFIELTARARQTTEISMTARFLSAKLLLPEVLMGFGLELVGQRTAGSIRKYLEEDYGAKADTSKL